MDELEDLIDRTSLGRVLNQLIDICDGKAEHLAVNWQDDVAARRWSKAARRLEACRNTTDILTLE